MKIALCLERFDPALGGQAIWTRGFAAHLLEMGHEVHVVSTAFGDHGLPVRQHAVPPFWAPLTGARRFRDVLETLGASVVHDAGVTIWPAVWHPHTGSALGAQDRLIATESRARRVRAAVSPKMRLLRTQMRWLEARQARRAAGIVAVSDLVRRLLERRHPGARTRIETIPNGTDTRFFTPPAEKRRPQSLPGDVVFLAVAHNPALKGLDVALRALAALVRDGHAVRLMVAGVGTGTIWSGMAEALGLAGRVAFLGQAGDMRPVYHGADVLVHPTRWDANSLVVLEAMACGLPVITSRMNGAAEAIAPDVAGFILPDPEDFTALAAHMRLLLDPERRARFGTAARAAIESRDIRVNHRAVEALLLRVAQGVSAADRASHGR